MSRHRTADEPNIADACARGPTEQADIVLRRPVDEEIGDRVVLAVKSAGETLARIACDINAHRHPAARAPDVGGIQALGRAGVEIDGEFVVARQVRAHQRELVQIADGDDAVAVRRRRFRAQDRPHVAVLVPDIGEVPARIGRRRARLRGGQAGAAAAAALPGGVDVPETVGDRAAITGQAANKTALTAWVSGHRTRGIGIAYRSYI